MTRTDISGGEKHRLESQGGVFFFPALISLAAPKWSEVESSLTGLVYSIFFVTYIVNRFSWLRQRPFLLSSLKSLCVFVRFFKSDAIVLPFWTLWHHFEWKLQETCRNRCKSRWIVTVKRRGDSDFTEALILELLSSYKRYSFVCNDILTLLTFIVISISISMCNAKDILCNRSRPKHFFNWTSKKLNAGPWHNFSCLDRLQN